ncbi:hypothetical protein DdX_17234 [Ditylenchus destructor]|uniref:Uncharacterized protein n=1 Tax=Ditylenchus destructor TaxID=166010 RepID=A0AAD4MMQ3_9BILA|nr:hypothetical protein DdX_17234 [Ditylenchus destructor]
MAVLIAVALYGALGVIERNNGEKVDFWMRHNSQQPNLSELEHGIRFKNGVRIRVQHGPKYLGVKNQPRRCFGFKDVIFG